MNSANRASGAIFSWRSNARHYCRVGVDEEIDGSSRLHT